MNRYIEKKEDEAESLRVLYVALTRAADYLILSGGLDAKGRPHSLWMKHLAAHFDLQTGLPKGDPYLGTALKIKGARRPFRKSTCITRRRPSRRFLPAGANPLRSRNFAKSWRRAKAVHSPR